MIPSIEEVARIIDLPVLEWERLCCDICIKILKSRIVDGTLKDGYFIGEIHPDSIFLQNGHIDKLRHCWIELDDGRIIDPTIWTITNENPYIYFGDNNGNYTSGQILGFSFYGY